MRLISSEVYDLELEHTCIDIEKEYEKVSRDDPCFIFLINSVEDALAKKAGYNKNAEALVKLKDANDILINAILSLRHILISQISISKLERPEIKVDYTPVVERKPWWKFNR